MSRVLAPDFNGAKIAILRGGTVLTLQRDDRADIPFPGQWDLPGGGREGNETPLETVSRELFEELSVLLDVDKIIHHSVHAQETAAGETVHFFVAIWEDLKDAEIVLGDEGQSWLWMPVSEFVSRKDAVRRLRDRLRRVLATLDEPLTN